MSWTDADIAPASEVWSDDDIAVPVKRNMLQKAGDLLQKHVITPAKNIAEVAIEPALAVGTGAIGQAVGNVAGAAGDIYSRLNGTANIGGDVRNDVSSALTYQPRNPMARALLEKGGEVLDKSKLAGLPVVGNEMQIIASGIPAGVNAAGNVVRGARESVGGAAQRGAQSLMINALKPTPTQITSGDAAIAASELLKRGINPNTAGVVKLKNLINDLGERTKNVIGNADGTVSQQEVLGSLDRVKNKFINQADPQADLAAIAGVEDRFATHPGITSDAIPVQQAQDLKQGTYKVLEGKYGEQGSAATEAQKALASGLRKGIEKVVPDVIPLNAEQSALIDTLGVAERKAALELAKDPAQLTGMLRSPAAWAAFTANKSSMFKSVLAQMLDFVGSAIRPKGVTAVPPPVAMAEELRRIPINKDIPYNGFPHVGEPPVIPQSWNEGLQPTPTKTPLPVIPDQLNPLSEQYPQSIPIGAAEGRMPQPSIPLPKLYPDPRPTMELAEPQATAQALRQPEGNIVNFPLKTEVLQQPEIIAATDAFRLQAQQLKEAIAAETNGFKRAQLEATLRGVENRFGAGAHLLGGESAADFYGPNYSSGTRFGVQKTFDPREMAAQLRRTQ